MPYEVQIYKGVLLCADEKVHNLIKELIDVKNLYIKENRIGCKCGAEYSRTLHTLDLLQYLVVEKRSASYIRSEMELALENFEIAKQILNTDTIEKIQYCIDVLEEYVVAAEVMQNLK